MCLGLLGVFMTFMSVPRRRSGRSSVTTAVAALPTECHFSVNVQRVHQLVSSFNASEPVNLFHHGTDGSSVAITE